MRVDLVAMPWLAERSPSMALATLGAYLKRETPHTVEYHHEYLEVCRQLGVLYRPLSLADRMGEVIYAAHLHPEGRERAKERFIRWARHERVGYMGWRDGSSQWPDGDEGQQFDLVWTITRAHLESFDDGLDAEARVVGFTTTCCQLFASLAAARRIKTRRPDCAVVLGGMGVATADPAALLAAYPFVDYVIHGDGELPLATLLDAIETGSPMPRCVTAVASEPLNALPPPDFDAYCRSLDDFDYPVWPLLPIEVTRPGRGELHASIRSHRRIVCDVAHLVSRHRRLRLMLVGDVLAGDGVEPLTAALESLGCGPNFACHLPTTISPYEMLRLWEIGCDKVEFDVETLSAAYLRRSESPTRVIEVLQAMRTCYELGVKNFSTLASGLPGMTAAEFAESLSILSRYAICYQPLEIRPRTVFRNERTHTVLERLGIGHTFNSRDFQEVLPEGVWAAVHLPWLDIDASVAEIDWHELDAVVASWNRLHRELLVLDGVTWFVGTRPLYYFDGGDHLLVVDRRRGHRDVTLDELTGDLYVFCMEIRSRGELHQRFADRCSADELDEIVSVLVDEDLMFAEGDRLLSLAVAYRVELAVRRMRAQRATPGGYQNEAAGV